MELWVCERSRFSTGAHSAPPFTLVQQCASVEQSVQQWRFESHPLSVRDTLAHPPCVSLIVPDEANAPTPGCSVPPTRILSSAATTATAAAMATATTIKTAAMTAMTAMTAAAAAAAPASAASAAAAAASACGLLTLPQRWSVGSYIYHWYREGMEMSAGGESVQ